MHSIIQVYALHRGRQTEEMIEFTNELQLLVDRVRGEKKIIMGDLNAHVGTRGVERRVCWEYTVWEREMWRERIWWISR